MSILLFALIFNVSARSTTTSINAVAPASYPLHCKMKAVSGDIEARMDTTGKFSFVVNFQGKVFTCPLDPLEITRTRDEAEEGKKPEGKWKQGIAFSNRLNCLPPGIPDAFRDNLNKDMEWILREKSMEFFVENGEPAIACTPIKYNKKQADVILAGVKKRLPPLAPD